MAERLSLDQKAIADAEKRRLKLFAAERARTTREKYKMKEIRGWMNVGPALALVTALIVGLILWISHTRLSSGHYWFFAVAAASLIVRGLAEEVKDEWVAARPAKYEVAHQLWPDGSHFSELQQYDGDYEYDYVYTDSLFGLIVYQFAKTLLAIFNVAVGIALAILLFLWLGTINIAPTTIIIILLIVIIFNQSSR